MMGTHGIGRQLGTPAWLSPPLGSDVAWADVAVTGLDIIFLLPSPGPPPAETTASPRTLSSSYGSWAASPLGSFWAGPGLAMTSSCCWPLGASLSPYLLRGLPYTLFTLPFDCVCVLSVLVCFECISVCLSVYVLSVCVL